MTYNTDFPEEDDEEYKGSDLEFDPGYYSDAYSKAEEHQRKIDEALENWDYEPERKPDIEDNKPFIQDYIAEAENYYESKRDEDLESQAEHEDDELYRELEKILNDSPRIETPDIWQDDGLGYDIPNNEIYALRELDLEDYGYDLDDSYYDSFQDSHNPEQIPKNPR